MTCPPRGFVLTPRPVERVLQHPRHLTEAVEMDTPNPTVERKPILVKQTDGRNWTRLLRSNSSTAAAGKEVNG